MEIGNKYWMSYIKSDNFFLIKLNYAISNNFPQRSMLLSRLILGQCKYFIGIKMKIMPALLEIKNWKISKTNNQYQV